MKCAYYHDLEVMGPNPGRVDLSLECIAVSYISI